MRIQHNMAAVNAQRQLFGNNNNVSKNLEKLSSGYRINRAGDDAAGLGISEKMRCQIAGLDQAKGNCSDGISLVQTAEGALTEVHSILNRMTELATQASNGTYDDTVDRPNLQKEVDNLLGEVDRIAQYTNFNGMSLLDGSLSGSGSSGANLKGAPAYSVEPATGSKIAQTDTSGTDLTIPETINIDGVEIRVDWSVLDSIQRGAVTKNFSAGGGATADDVKKAAKAMQSAINTAISKNNAGGGPSVEPISVFSDPANPTQFKFMSSKQDNTSKIEIKSGANGLLGTMFNAGAADVSLAAPDNRPKFQQADITGDFTMNLGGQSLKVSLNPGGTTPDDVVRDLQAAIDTTLGNYDTARGATGSDAYAGQIRVSFGRDGSLEFSNNTGQSLGFSDVPGNEFAKNLGISTEAKATAGGGLTLQVGDTADSYNKVTVSVGDMRATSLGLTNIRVDTQEASIAAIPKIRGAIDRVSGTRGDLGAIQNRLEHTINNLGVTSENMTASESRIRDVDMAQEMMTFTKNNILSQAAQSMLSQANQIPQGVLQLLQ